MKMIWIVLKKHLRRTMCLPRFWVWKKKANMIKGIYTHEFKKQENSKITHIFDFKGEQNSNLEDYTAMLWGKGVY